MFNKFELMIAVRYLRARNKGFISFISFISIAGIALGVAALIIVLSVMNGFQKEIRNKIVGASAHIQVFSDTGFTEWQNIAKSIKKIPSVLDSAPYIDGQGLFAINGNVNGVLIRGISPVIESKVDDIVQNITEGSSQNLEAGFNVLIGKELSEQYNINIGDKITLVTPNTDGNILIPRMKQFAVTGIFDAKLYEYNTSLVYIGINKARALFRMPDNSVTGLRLKVNDVMQTQEIKNQIYDMLQKERYQLHVQDWIDQHRTYFSAVALEKRMMFIILSLIIGVALFNLIATMLMTINSKASSIAIMRTMGATKLNIVKIFMLYGFFAGGIGTFIGATLGVIVSYKIEAVVNFLQHVFHKQLISQAVYMIDYLPSQIQLHDVFLIVGTSLFLSIVASIYPSIVSASIHPAQSLRYE